MEVRIAMIICILLAGCAIENPQIQTDNGLIQISETVNQPPFSEDSDVWYTNPNLKFRKIPVWIECNCDSIDFLELNQLQNLSKGELVCRICELKNEVEHSRKLLKAQGKWK